MNRPFLCAALLAIATCIALAQEPAARTVQVHSQDIVPIHAKVKYTTLIEVPATEIHSDPPTITIREGHRIKVYFTQHMLLPVYENHTIPQTF